MAEHLYYSWSNQRKDTVKGHDAIFGHEQGIAGHRSVESFLAYKKLFHHKMRNFLELFLQIQT